MTKPRLVFGGCTLILSFDEYDNRIDLTKIYMFENTPLEHLSFKALIYKFIVEEGCLFF